MMSLLLLLHMRERERAKKNSNERFFKGSKPVNVRFLLPFSVLLLLREEFCAGRPIKERAI